MRAVLTLGIKIVVLLAVAVLLVQGVIAVTDYKIDHLRLKKSADPVEFVTMAERERQLNCLAKNIYYEAGIESFEGKVAVAQVTINRTQHNQFPNDICAVVYQKNVIYEKVICQFSWYCLGHQKVKAINNAAYAESYTVAKKVLLEGFRLDALKDAIYYHADYVNPGWKKVKIIQIGRHIFYRG